MDKAKAVQPMSIVCEQLKSGLKYLGPFV
uniref:Uncharacterized protein n=1 Tax=Anguilla anguilla TaxID=7936 RepID=A0A0E9T1H2_ANGAN